MTEINPFISVVMSNYNGERYLKAAIDSILSQEYDNFEVLLIDDGSEDGSFAIMESYAQKLPKFRAVRLTENQGQANGFNIGIQEARGTLVAFMDSDDLWYPEKLRSVAQLSVENPGAVFFQHNLNIRYNDRPTKTSFKRTLPQGDLLDEMKRFDRVHQFSPTSGLTFRKSVLELVGPIPLDFKTCADGYLTRTSMCFGQVCATMACLGEYRIHGANATVNNPAYSADKYLRTLLFPQLQQFYDERRIDFDFVAFQQRMDDVEMQTFVRAKHTTKVFILSVASALLSRLAETPVMSRVCGLLPGFLRRLLNDKRLAKLRNKHDAQRAFIIGKSTQLEVGELEQLSDEITLAGASVLGFLGRTDWRPTYFCEVSKELSVFNRSEIQSLKSTKVCAEELGPALGSSAGIIWVRTRAPQVDREGREYFRISEDLRLGAYGCRSAELFQVQLALHMGIREIYLLGDNLKRQAFSELENGVLLALSNYAKNNGIQLFSITGSAWGLEIEPADLANILA